MRKLQAASVAAAAVAKGPELLGDDYFQSIGFFVDVGLPGSQMTELQRGLPVRFASSECDPFVRRRAPHIGEHTKEVLEELLGIDQSQYLELVGAGAIGGTR